MHVAGTMVTLVVMACGCGGLRFGRGCGYGCFSSGSVSLEDLRNMSCYTRLFFHVLFSVYVFCHAVYVACCSQMSSAIQRVCFRTSPCATRCISTISIPSQTNGDTSYSSRLIPHSIASLISIVAQGSMSNFIRMRPGVPRLSKVAQDFLPKVQVGNEGIGKGRTRGQMS